MLTKENKTLTQLFIPGIEHDDRLHVQLEKYRVKWEAINRKKTDPTITYTTMLSQETQNRMIEESPESYALGWPPYVQEFFKTTLARRYIEKGRTDEMLPESIRAYCTIARLQQRQR